MNFQRRLQRGKCQLVDAQRPGERIGPQFRDDFRSSDNDAALRTAQQFVAAEQHKVGTARRLSLTIGSSGRPKRDRS